MRFMSELDHIHKWVPKLDKGLAFYEKREGGKKFYCWGTVMECASQPCQSYFIIPFNKELQAVEAVLAA